MSNFSCELLLALTEDITCLTTIEQNSFSLFKENFNLDNAIKEVFEMFRIKSETKKIPLEYVNFDQIELIFSDLKRLK